MFNNIQDLEGIYLGYVALALKNNLGISRDWTNYTISAASTI
jgi:hypothetical protein